MRGNNKSFWWRYVLKLLEKYKGMASVLISDGKSCLLWEDLWNGLSQKVSVRASELFMDQLK